jgi:nucleoid DNA-binding protein
LDFVTEPVSEKPRSRTQGDWPGATTGIAVERRGRSAANSVISRIQPKLLCYVFSASHQTKQESRMAVKKKAAKKAAATKAPSAAPAVKAITAKQTKTQIIAAIAESTNLSKKDVGAVFSSLGQMIESHMKRRGSGEFTIPDTGVKIRRVKKPARKARMGRNPATGEAMKIAAKPASTVVRVTALKALKDTIG